RSRVGGSPPTEAPSDRRRRRKKRSATSAGVGRTRKRISSAPGHRLGKFLLRRGLVWRGGKKAWTQLHRQWVRSLRFEQPADQAVVASYLLAIEQLEERWRTLESS